MDGVVGLDPLYLEMYPHMSAFVLDGDLVYTQFFVSSQEELRRAGKKKEQQDRTQSDLPSGNFTVCY